MKILSGLLFTALIFLSSCYGNPEQNNEKIGEDLKSDSTLIPVDSAERDHTETIKSDTVSGKAGRVNGM